MFEECLYLQTKLNKVSFSALDCSFVVSQPHSPWQGAMPGHLWWGTAGLLPQSALGGAGSKVLSLGGRNEALLIREFL